MTASSTPAGSAPAESTKDSQSSNRGAESGSRRPALGYAGDPTPEELERRQIRVRVEYQLDESAPYEAREKEVLRIAEEVFAQTGIWVVFFRTMMGLGGVVRTLFPSSDDLQRFYVGEAHAELQEMIAAMRSSDQSKGDATEPERMITIRIPMSLHELLTAEAASADLSVNRLCLGKLIQPLLDRHTPEPQGQRRGRRPGPQERRR